MLSAIAIIPSAPVLVPELAGDAAGEVADLRAAMIAAVATLPPRWIVIGVGTAAATIEPDSAGTFAGFGVDVPVRFSPHAAGQVAPMPVAALIAGWIRGQAQPDAVAQVRIYPDNLDSRIAVDIGRRLRAEIDQMGEAIGVLVVADGANTLTRSAPGGHRPADVEVQDALYEALATGDVSMLSQLPPQVTGRVAFGVLAGLTEPSPRSVKELCRTAPYGVGYFAGVWQS